MRHLAQKLLADGPEEPFDLPAALRPAGPGVDQPDPEPRAPHPEPRAPHPETDARHPERDAPHPERDAPDRGTANPGADVFGPAPEPRDGGDAAWGAYDSDES